MLFFNLRENRQGRMYVCVPGRPDEFLGMGWVKSGKRMQKRGCKNGKNKY